MSSSEPSPARICSVVIPLYNEEEVLPAFHERLVAVLKQIPCRSEIVYVDDGSTDKTPEILAGIAAGRSGVVILNFSRNFGHQAAFTAGIEHATGDVVITMDGDGEHPPQLLPQMIALHEQGFDVVQTRRINPKEGLFNNVTAGVFYRAMNYFSELHLEPGVGDFRLMSRTVVDSLKRMPEKVRFLRGMVSWLGYRTVLLPYETAPRLAGRPKYTLSRLWKLAHAGLFSFSTFPLNLALYAGCGILLVALAEVVYVGWTLLVAGFAGLPLGWTSLMLAVLLLGGGQLVMLGLQGFYIGMLFHEIKGRPVYLVLRRFGGPPVSPSGTAAAGSAPPTPP